MIRKTCLTHHVKLFFQNQQHKRFSVTKTQSTRPIKIGTDSIRYTVSGVMGDIPENTHFEANILTSFMTNPRSKDPIWMNNSFSTYFLLKPNTSYKTVDEKFPELLKKYVGPELQQYMGIIN